MDSAQEQEMLLNASTAAAILRVAGRYTLVELDGGPLPDPKDPAWHGAEFYGSIAFASGRISVSLEQPIDPADMRVVSAAFAQLVAGKSKPQAKASLWLHPEATC